MTEPLWLRLGLDDYDLPSPENDDDAGDRAYDQQKDERHDHE